MATFMGLLVVVSLAVFVFGEEQLFNLIYKAYSFLWSPCIKVTIEMMPMTVDMFPELEMDEGNNTGWDLESDDDTAITSWDALLDTGIARVTAIDRAFRGEAIAVVKKQNNTFINSLDYSLDSEGNYKPSSIKWYPSIQTGVVKDRATRSTWFVMP